MSRLSRLGWEKILYSSEDRHPVVTCFKMQKELNDRMGMNIVLFWREAFKLIKKPSSIDNWT